MKQNDFYEVDGCTDFIPVKLIEEHKHLINALELEVAESGLRTFAPSIYSFPKVNEPQKVVIPKFVAEWIKWCKHSGWHLQKVLSRLDDDEKVGDWAYDENDDLIPDKVDMIARAWLDGYEVEKEKLYTVEIEGVSSGRIFKNIQTNKFLFHSGKGLKGYTDKLTEQEIKKVDERLWQFAKEV